VSGARLLLLLRRRRRLRQRLLCFGLLPSTAYANGILGRTFSAHSPHVLLLLLPPLPLPLLLPASTLQQV
jgi:hypothetical protein